MLESDYTFEVIDAASQRMTWGEFEPRIRTAAPKYYLTHCTAQTLTNDMYGVTLAKGIGATTMAFGTHVTAMPTETMRDFPALDFVIQGESELTFREIIDVMEGCQSSRPEWVQELLEKTDANWKPSPEPNERGIDLSQIKGLVWRDRGQIRINNSRPFIRDLSDLPIPLHAHLSGNELDMPLKKNPLVLLVNPPAPDGRIWFSTHYRGNVHTRTEIVPTRYPLEQHAVMLIGFESRLDNFSQ